MSRAGRVTGGRPPLRVVAWVVILTLGALGPVLLARGFSLVGDMVFVPDQPWKDRWLALDGSVPRSVPSDALVSILTQAVPGDLLQKAVLVAILVGAGVGMARLLVDQGVLAASSAATLYLWNPFVYERLAIGHWALLAGYAALPWVVASATAVRDRGVGSVWGLGVGVLVASWTSPSGGVLASLVAVTVVLGRPRMRTLAATVVVCVMLNLPWVLPGLFVSGGGADPKGIGAFTAAADTPLGVLGSLVTFGGLWKTSVAAPGRETWLLAALALTLTAAGLTGLVLCRRQVGRTGLSLAVLGVLGVLLAWLPALAGVQPAFAWVGVHVPGGGVLRDSQKWVAPWVLLVCLGLGLLAGLGGRWLRGTGESLGWLVPLVVLPVVVLPGMVWGQFGRLEPGAYPDEWRAVADLMEQSGAAQDRTVVLPFEVYRRFPWNDQRAVLDPAPRFFPGDVVTNDSLPVGDGVRVQGEDPTAARIAAVIADRPGALGSVLRDERVRWVLTEKTTAAASDGPEVGGEVRYDGRYLRLVQLPVAGAGPVTATTVRRPVLITVDILVATLGGLFVVMATRRRARAYTPGAGD